MKKIEIQKNNVAVLTPFEFDRLHDVIKKSDYQIFLNTALLTGMRYVELQKLQKNPDWLLRERRCIYLPKEATKKKKRKMIDRYVSLTPVGMNYVTMFFKIRQLPRKQQMNHLLTKWATNAGLREDGDIRLSVKALRKTWESWLAISYPNMIDYICMNQGHTNFTAVRHYLQLPFSDDEKNEIKVRTAGWGNGN